MKIEIVLCENADDDLRNYTNVFSELSLWGRERFSFTAVCNLKFEEDRESEIALHFFLMKRNEGGMKGQYLSQVLIERSEEDMETEEYAFKLDFNNVRFEPGRLSFVAVRHDGIKDTNGQHGHDIFKSGDIVGKTEFVLNN